MLSGVQNGFTKRYLTAIEPSLYKQTEWDDQQAYISSDHCTRSATVDGVERVDTPDTDSILVGATVSVIWCDVHVRMEQVRLQGVQNWNGFWK
jgi:hypothetical protein